MISYDGLKKQLKKKQLKISDLATMAGISSRTIAKINRNEKIQNFVLSKICTFLNCRIEDLVEESYDNQLLCVLRNEMEHKVSGGIYYELQVRMTYHSSHMEGSKLSEDQTRMIFETNTLNAGDGVPIDDILETIHHFRAMDYCIRTAEEKLSEEHIKTLHYLLKHDTKDAELSWFAVGDYKKRPNVIGGRETVKPEEVEESVRTLLVDYNRKKKIQFEDIVTFHVAFERIHPFQDGNGRVGRLIAFKECLRHNIVPFIIEDSKKAFYYRGLSNWDTEQGFLMETCLDGQDTISNLIRYFDISY